MAGDSPVADIRRRAHTRALFALVGFAAVVTAKIAVVQWLLLGGVSAVGCALDLLFMFVLFTVIDLAFADLRLRAYLVLNAVLSVLLVALALYHAYYGVLPSRQTLLMVGQATTVGGGIMTLLKPQYLLLFVDLPLIASWVVRLRRRGIDPLTGSRPGALVVPGLRTPYVYQWRSVYVAALAASFALVWSVRATTASPDARDALAVASTRGVGSYLMVALSKPKTDAASGTKTPAAALQAQIDKLAGHTVGAPLAGFTPGEARGMNVIVIQVEALQSIAVGRSVGGVAVTPNLDEMIKGSWYFPGCVSGAGVGTTADVEFVTNTSLYPPSDVGASLGYSDHVLTSLPRVLNSLGYRSYTFHTNTAGFWNRSQFYPAIGFTRYFDQTYFGTADAMAFGSASDQVLFTKTLPQLEKAQKAKRPFYAQVITISSHYPFRNVPPDRRTLRLVPPYEGTIVGDYLTEMHYVDEQIGRFVANLKQDGLWDDSIVVVYGDHFGLPETGDDGEARALRELTGHDYNKADWALVPLIVHIPEQSLGVRVATSVGQVDLVPSLSDALGVDAPDQVHFGRSIFRSGSGLTAAGGLLEPGAYADGSVLYVPGIDFERGKAFDIATHRPTTLARASAEKMAAARELLGLSAQYVGTLPIRADFNPNAEITFPLKK